MKSAGVCRFEYRGSEKFGVGEDVGDEERWLAPGCQCRERNESFAPGSELIQDNFGQLVFVGVANDATDAGQGGDFRGSTLSVTSGDDDFSQRILALHAADGGAGILIGGMRNRAGVQDYEVGVGRGGAGQAAGFELAFERGAVGLGGAASEIFDVVSAHGIMVAQ